ncbi:MAG TPA: MnmC family methyltransferase [Polyangiales bacterium]|nr:MnmC family methyltransferase [Polyangiales bacterium]
MYALSESRYELVQTPSGALAVHDREIGETMHPNGPALEGTRLYVEPSRLRERLAQASAKPLLLLDVGLGAASNSLAALRVSESLSTGRRLSMLSFDRTLAPMQFALEKQFVDSAGARALAKLGSGFETPRSSWQLRLGDLREQLTRCPEASADVVFWDPNSPRVQPALWNVSTFSILRRVCREGATVHTFSGATAVRAALLLAGFAVGLGPALGPKQKRSTMAAVSARDLSEPLNRSWLRDLSASGLPDDAPADALEQLHAAPQFR